jgi:hypothetical protein
MALPALSYVTSSARLPLGVAILSFLIGVFGFFVLLVGTLILVLGVGAGLVGGSTVFGLTGAIAGLVVFIIGVIILAVAVGLWNQELWALALAVIVLLFYGALELVSGAWLGLLIVGGLLVYLLAVSSAFD